MTACLHTEQKCYQQQGWMYAVVSIKAVPPSEGPNSPVCVWTPLSPAASRYRPAGQRAASAESAGNGCPWNTISKLVERPNTPEKRNRGGKGNSAFQRTALWVFHVRLSSLWLFTPLTHLSSCLLRRQSGKSVQGKNWPLCTWLVRITKGFRNFGHKLQVL